MMSHRPPYPNFNSRSARGLRLHRSKPHKLSIHSSFPIRSDPHVQLLLSSTVFVCMCSQTACSLNSIQFRSQLHPGLIDQIKLRGDDMIRIIYVYKLQFSDGLGDRI
nr:hypothetical protein Iba_chr13aCG4490 [Ipomoea batatas]